jgi:hypothetical protein
MFTLQEFFLFCIAVTGMTLILVQGSIFEPLRAKLARTVANIERNREENNLSKRFTIVELLHKILQCFQCAGFWCGIFCGFFILSSDFLSSSHTAQVTLKVANVSMWSFVVSSGFSVIRWMMILFCCGVAGSFLAPLGDLLLQLIYISKELIAKQLQPDSHTINEHNHEHNHNQAHNQDHKEELSIENQL